LILADVVTKANGGTYSAPTPAGGAMEEQPVEGTIELVVPADTRLVRLARLVASGIGSAAGFDVEEIEDLRIAVDEGCSALIEAGVESPLLLSFEVDGDGVVVLGSTEASTEATQDPERLSLSDQILRVVTDEHELGASRGRATFRFTKRSRAGSARNGG
jgi:serine/threonine-protein kinase RsbW